MKNRTLMLNKAESSANTHTKKLFCLKTNCSIFCKYCFAPQEGQLFGFIHNHDLQGTTQNKGANKDRENNNEVRCPVVLMICFQITK